MHPGRQASAIAAQAAPGPPLESAVSCPQNRRTSPALQPEQPTSRCQQVSLKLFNG